MNTSLLRAVARAVLPREARRILKASLNTARPGGGAKMRVEPLMYRPELFRELNDFYDTERFAGKRILEIGPKDGLDTKRLASLQPSYLCAVDIPEKRETSDLWIVDIPQPFEYVEGNILYLTEDEVARLGRYDLIWFTGVLYHRGGLVCLNSVARSDKWNHATVG